MLKRNEGAEPIGIKVFFDSNFTRPPTVRSYDNWAAYIKENIKEVPDNKLFLLILNINFSEQSSSKIYWDALERLEKVVSNADFEELLNAAPSSSENFKRAYFFCLVETYQQIREGLGCQYKSTTAAISSCVSYLIPSYLRPASSIVFDLTKKSAAAVGLKKFICSDFELTKAGLSEFLIKAGLTEIEPVLEDGLLKLITSRVVKASPKAAMQYP